jgi:hypothetical protein
MHGSHGCWLLWTRPGLSRALFYCSPVLVGVSFTAPCRAASLAGPARARPRISTVHAWPVRVLAALDPARAHPGAVFSLACDPVRVVYRAISCLPRALVQLGLDHASARCMHGPYGCCLLWTRPGPTRVLFSRSPVILCVSFTAPYRAYLARWSSSGPFTLSTLHAWPVRVLPALDAARAHPGAVFSLAGDPVRVVYRAMSCLPRALVQLGPVHPQHAACMARTGAACSGRGQGPPGR